MSLMSTESEGFYDLAKLWFDTGEFEKAAGTLGTLARMEPDCAPVRLLLARSYMSIPAPGDGDDVVAVWLKRSLAAYRMAVELADQFGGLSEQELATANEAIAMFERLAEEKYHLPACEPEAPRSDLTIELGSLGLVIRGAPVSLLAGWPAIAAMLGSATRVSRSRENDVYTWDGLGVTACCRAGKTSVLCFDVWLQQEPDFPHTPRDAFHGTLVVEGEEIVARRAYSQFKRLGFEASSFGMPYQKRAGAYEIIVTDREYSDCPLEVSICAT